MLKIVREINPQTVNPINTVSAVLVTNRPTSVPIGTESMVAINPVMAAPMPAMCPMGSIAIERRFPNKNPMAKNCTAKNPIKTSTLGLGWDQKMITYKKETAV